MIRYFRLTLEKYFCIDIHTVTHESRRFRVMFCLLQRRTKNYQNTTKVFTKKATINFKKSQKITLLFYVTCALLGFLFNFDFKNIVLITLMFINDFINLIKEIFRMNEIHYKTC